MKGKLWLIRPGETTPTVIQYDEVIMLDDLQDAVGGFIETVPFFFSFHDPDEGRRVRCVAFCHEEGKLEGLPYNHGAQLLWQAALDAFFAEANDGKPVTNDDQLVGPIVIVTGDDEFLAAL
jgi:hypothetical protein